MYIDLQRKISISNGFKANEKNLEALWIADNILSAQVLMILFVLTEKNF